MYRIETAPMNRDLAGVRDFVDFQPLWGEYTTRADAEAFAAELLADNDTLFADCPYQYRVVYIPVTQAS